MLAEAIRLGSDTKDSVTHSTAGGTSFLVPVPLACESMWVLWSGLSRFCTYFRFMLQLRIPMFKKLPRLYRGHWQIFPNFALKGGITFLFSRQGTNLFSALEEDTTSVFQGYMLYKHPWVNSLRQNLPQDIETPWRFTTSTWELPWCIDLLMLLE